MDGLIVILLIIIGVAAKSSKKKKQQAQQRARQAGYDEISAVPPPLMRKEAQKAGEKTPAADSADLSEKGKTKDAKPKLPYTKEDWAELLTEMDGSAADTKQRAAKALLRSGDSSLIAEMETGVSAQSEKEAHEGRKFQTLTAQRLTAERLRPDARHLEGESHKEHAAHKQRIADEEARLHREREELNELRNVNLKKLRSAVVMSEVLGKPVALRPRGR